MEGDILRSGGRNTGKNGGIMQWRKKLEESSGETEESKGQKGKDIGGKRGKKEEKEREWR